MIPYNTGSHRSPDVEGIASHGQDVARSEFEFVPGVVGKLCVLAGSEIHPRDSSGLARKPECPGRMFTNRDDIVRFSSKRSRGRVTNEAEPFFLKIRLAQSAPPATHPENIRCINQNVVGSIALEGGRVAQIVGVPGGGIYARVVTVEPVESGEPESPQTVPP